MKRICKDYALNLDSIHCVYREMQIIRRSGMALALSGAALFVLILYLSAYWEADIRWLHFFQSWLYIVSAVLLLRRNKWGCFIGIGTAFFWDYVNLLVTTFLRNGVEQVRLFIATGHLSRPDQFTSVPAWIGNAALIMGCTLVYIASFRGRSGDALRLLASFVGSCSFFALIMFLFQPRYLALFPAALHPRWRL